MHKKESYLRFFSKEKIFLVFFPPFLFIASALTKVIPSLVFDSPTPFFTTPVYKSINFGLWVLILIAVLMGEIMMRIHKIPITWKGLGFIYMGALILATLLEVVFAHGWVDNISNSPWNAYYLNPDSGGYVAEYDITTSMRAPVYPYFVDLTTYGSHFNHSIGQRPIEKMISTTLTQDPLLGTVQIQKILLFSSIILLSIVLVYSFQSFLPIPLILLVYDFNYLTAEKSYIMTEAVAQTWLILCVACLFLLVYKNWIWSIPAVGLFCSLAYLTRPASAYTFLIFAGLILWAGAKQFKKNLPYMLAAVLISASILFGYIFLIHNQTGKWTISPFSTLPHIGSALLVTQPGDMQFMPDDELKQYYQLINQKIEQYGYKSKTGISYRLDEFNANTYQIALPALSEMKLSQRHYDDTELINKTADIIISHHLKDYFQLIFDLIVYSFEISRFTNFGLAGLLLLVFAAAFILKNKTAFCAVILVLVHLSNIVISCTFGVPLTRYLAMTEILVLLALYILAMEGLVGIKRKFLLSSDGVIPT